MRSFIPILLISFSLITIVCCSQTKQESPLIDSLKQGDTLTLYAQYSEWGEWGGHIEKVCLTVKGNDLFASYYKDEVARHQPFTKRTIIKNTSKILTTSDRNCIVKYIKSFKTESSKEQESSSNSLYDFEIRSKSTKLLFSDWSKSWKGFSKLQKELFN